MDKYQNKYRIPSARLQSWDYCANGVYFITICTAHREHYFGEIVETQFIASFIASEIGNLAEQYWAEIPNHFPFIELGNFVVMPNHVHGILIVDKNANANVNANAYYNSNVRADANLNANDVETRLIASLPSPIASLPSPIASLPSHTKKIGGFAGSKNPMFHENISRTIRWYKGRCSFEMRKIHADFAWQSRFYDHIIRDSAEFERIQNYIANNPMNWKNDKFNSDDV